MADLEFDLDDLKKMKRLCDRSQTDVETLNRQISRRLKELESTWNTPAGSRFFRELYTDMQRQAKRYAVLTGAIGRFLESAVSSYGRVLEEAESLSRIHLAD